MEVAATGIGKCQMCFNRVEQGEVRLVVKAKTTSFLRKVGLCKRCSIYLIENWELQLDRIAYVLHNPEVRCPKCKEHGPMKFTKDVLQKNHSYKPGWVCEAKGHFFAKLRQILWPARKRGV